MSVQAHLADGTVLEFPDGTNPDVIDRVVKSHIAPPDDSRLHGLALGALKPVDNLVRGAVAALPPGVVNAVDSAGSALGMPSSETAVASNNIARGHNTRTGYQTLGNIIGTAPTLALPGGAAVQGAAGGALLSNADAPEEIAIDAAMGGVGGKLGDVVTRGAAGVIAPKIGKYVTALKDAGIALTPGQIGRAANTTIGKFMARSEDKATSLPFVGEAILNDRDATIGQLNRAFTDRVLKPLGRALPDTVATGHDAVKYAQNAVSDAYRAVIPKVRGTIDKTFLTRTAAAKARANLLPEYAGKLDDIIKTEVGAMFDDAGNFAGKRTGQVLDRLDKLGAGFRKSDDPYTREMGDALGEIRKNVLDLVRRNNPDAGDALKAANAAHANLVRLENATANTAEGIATTGQLRSAVTRSDRSIRHRQSAGGQALGQDLAKAGAAVLPSKLADSGTFTRAAQANVLANAMGIAGLPIYAAAKRAAPLMTREAGPTAQTIAELVRRSGKPLSAAAPALLVSGNR